MLTVLFFISFRMNEMVRAVSNVSFEEVKIAIWQISEFVRGIAAHVCDCSSSKHSRGPICERHSGIYTDLNYFNDCARQIGQKYKNCISIYTQQKFLAAAIMCSNV